MRSSISAALHRSSRYGPWRTTAPLLALRDACIAVAVLVAAPAGAQTNPVPLERTAPASAPRAANEALENARSLLAGNRRDEALAVLERGLEEAPSDLRLRFQRGVLLAQMGRTDEAVAAFTELTQAFPELPEPHNNLATLHAQRGELDLARASLEEALRALPSYSLAHENLGDVQLRLAERSYQRALEADAANRAAREKLERTRELIARITPAPAARAPNPDSDERPAVAAARPAEPDAGR